MLILMIISLAYVVDLHFQLYEQKQQNKKEIFELKNNSTKNDEKAMKVSWAQWDKIFQLQDEMKRFKKLFRISQIQNGGLERKAKMLAITNSRQNEIIKKQAEEIRSLHLEISMKRSVKFDGEGKTCASNADVTNCDADKCNVKYYKLIEFFKKNFFMQIFLKNQKMDNLFFSKNM